MSPAHRREAGGQGKARLTVMPLHRPDLACYSNRSLGSERTVHSAFKGVRVASEITSSLDVHLLFSPRCFCSIPYSGGGRTASLSKMCADTATGRWQRSTLHTSNISCVRWMLMTSQCRDSTHGRLTRLQSARPLIKVKKRAAAVNARETLASVEPALIGRPAQGLLPHRFRVRPTESLGEVHLTLPLAIGAPRILLR